MARRFGGKHSPGQTSGGKTDSLRQARLEDARVDAAGARANILFLPPIPLVFLSLNDGAAALTVAVLSGAILVLAAWLLREGLRAEAAYDARPIARRPALPRKMLASLLTGIGIGLASATGDGSVLAAGLYGLIGLGLHVTAFGIDPLKDKRMEGVDTFQQDRVARVVDEAESLLEAMRGQIASLGDRKLDLAVARFQATARQMIRTVEEDPRDLTSARRYLGVYLMGARDASAKFADLYRRQRDESARTEYEALLVDLEENFAARTAKLLEGGRTDMDIEIKVLRDRLQREGVTPQE